MYGPISASWVPLKPLVHHNNIAPLCLKKGLQLGPPFTNFFLLNSGLTIIEEFVSSAREMNGLKGDSLMYDNIVMTNERNERSSYCQSYIGSLEDIQTALKPLKKLKSIFMVKRSKGDNLMSSWRESRSFALKEETWRRNRSFALREHKNFKYGLL